MTLESMAMLMMKRMSATSVVRSKAMMKLLMEAARFCAAIRATDSSVGLACRLMDQQEVYRKDERIPHFLRRSFFSRASRQVAFKRSESGIFFAVSRSSTKLREQIGTNDEIVGKSLQVGKTKRT